MLEGPLFRFHDHRRKGTPLSMQVVFEQILQVCKVSVSTMLAVVALDLAWAVWCWNVCLWTTARRARFPSLCGVAHRSPLQWWNLTTQRLGPFWLKKKQTKKNELTSGKRSHLPPFTGSSENHGLKSASWLKRICFFFPFEDILKTATLFRFIYFNDIVTLRGCLGRWCFWKKTTIWGWISLPSRWPFQGTGIFEHHQAPAKGSCSCIVLPIKSWN